METKLLHGCHNTFLIVDEYDSKTIKDKRQFTKDFADNSHIDGVLFLNKTEKADLEMIIFDKDGTLETMCGNGIRCFVRYAYDKRYISNKAKILTGDGIKNVEIEDDDLIKVFMGRPRKFKKINNQKYFVFTGVPHLIYFQDILSKRFSRQKGRELRYDQTLGLLVNHIDGININFVKITGKSNIEILTYEVGVEDLTQACGTGSTAAAYIAQKIKDCVFPINVKNPGGIIGVDLIGRELIMKGDAEYL